SPAADCNFPKGLLSREDESISRASARLRIATKLAASELDHETGISRASARLRIATFGIEEPSRFDLVSAGPQPGCGDCNLGYGVLTPCVIRYQPGLSPAADCNSMTRGRTVAAVPYQPGLSPAADCNQWHQACAVFGRGISRASAPP